ncbi:MAG: cation transporter [Spirochaetales bacterium]|nr:cation transporter [Spirochaetales bacterium]
MKKNKTGFRQFFRQIRTETKFRQNDRQIHKAIHAIPDSFQALVLELDDNPMSRKEIVAFFDNLRQRVFDRRDKKAGMQLDRKLEKCISLEVMAEKDGLYSLTEGGKEIAEHFRKVVPAFFALMFAPGTVSRITIAVHAVLTFLKFTFGFLSFSGGLISDGIDNAIDTLAAIGIRIGIRRKKERLVSLLIIIMMFVSVAGILYMGISKVIHPVPVSDGIVTLTISFICGLVMLGLSAWQYLAGKKTACFAFLCQAVDSRNHFITSLLVCAGIGLSYAAGALNLPFLLYADAAAAFVIGGIILKSAIELIGEFARGGEAETSNIKHFIGSSIEANRRKFTAGWLAANDPEGKYPADVLLQKYRDSCLKNTPRLFKLADLDFFTIPEEDFRTHLEVLLKRREKEN